MFTEANPAVRVLGDWKKAQLSFSKKLRPLHGVVVLQEEEAQGAEDQKPHGDPQADLRMEVQLCGILVAEGRLDLAQVDVLHHDKSRPPMMMRKEMVKETKGSPA